LRNQNAEILNPFNLSLRKTKSIKLLNQEISRIKKLLKKSAIY